MKTSVSSLYWNCVRSHRCAVYAYKILEEAYIGRDCTVVISTMVSRSPHGFTMHDDRSHSRSATRARGDLARSTVRKVHAHLVRIWYMGLKLKPCAAVSRTALKPYGFKAVRLYFKVVFKTIVFRSDGTDVRRTLHSHKPQPQPRHISTFYFSPQVTLC